MFVLTAQSADPKTVNALTTGELGYDIKVKDGVLMGIHNYTVEVLRDKGPTLYVSGSVNVLQVFKLDMQAVPSASNVDRGAWISKKVVVKNLGNGEDTITLRMTGDLPSWAKLSESSMKLGPGQSRNVTITITPPDNAAPERHELTVTGTSTGGARKEATLDYSINADTETATGGAGATALGFVPWLIVALAVGFVVGRCLVKARAERQMAQRPPEAWR